MNTSKGCCKQIRSHWKLAYKTFRKAVKVTISTLIQSIKARIYILSNEERLLKKQRRVKEIYNSLIEEELDNK